MMENNTLGREPSSEGDEQPAAQPAEPSRSPANGAAPEAENNMEALLRESDFAFRSLRRGETVEGTVVRVDQDEILVDVGLKSEGVIPQREMWSDSEDAEPLHVGDRVLVYVVQPEGSEGHAVLSLRRARMERSWREIEDLYNRGSIIQAPVVDFNKGGLIVDVKGVRGFVPVSQVLDLRNVSRQDGESEEVTQTLAAMNGRRLPLKIIEINRSRNRLILSERAAVQEQRTKQKDELLDQLQPGQIRRGVVSNLTSFGAFVDLGGADGLVHVSELSYNRVNHPSEILRVGQEVDVAVLSVDRDSKKIQLSLKRAQPDPWTTVEQRYHIGEVVPATITKLAKFGAFAKVEEGLEGLIHLSELTDLPVQDAAQVVREGDPVNVKIIHIQSQRRRLGLSVRQAQQPLSQYQSFGEVDTATPFSELEDYGTASEPAPSIPEPGEAEAPEMSAPADVALTPETAGEEDSPIAEHEPADSAPAEESAAVAPEDAPPASPEASLPTHEEEHPEVASAASQTTPSE
jgi:small subunit ribosomal protein S1